MTLPNHAHVAAEKDDDREFDNSRSVERNNAVDSQVHVSARAGAYSSVYVAPKGNIEVNQTLGRALGEHGLHSELASVRERYAPVPSDQWEKLVRVWCTSRLILITGAARIGKRTAALRLLSQTDPGTKLDGVDMSRIRELRKDWDRPDAGMLPARAGRTYLLDLGETAADSLPEEFGEQLRSFVDDHDFLNIRLVVTMTDEAYRRCARSLYAEKAPLSPPEAPAVAKEHLRSLGKHDREVWVDEPSLNSLLAGGTKPQDAVDLARAIAHADEPAENNEGDRGRVLGRVADEFRSWRGHLSAFFNGGRDRSAEDLALFIAAAVLDGAQPLHVWKAAMDLLGGYRATPTVEELLLGYDLEDKLSSITEAPLETVSHGVSLDSARHGLSLVVLPHLWQQRPQLRSSLLAWIRTIAAFGGVGQNNLSVVGRRLAVLAEKCPDFDIVDTLVDWVDGTSANRVLVGDLLTQLTGDSPLGTEIREKTRIWSYNYGKRTTSIAPAHAAEIVAEMCAGDFASKYPNGTLIRLKWLLNGPESDTIHTAATRSLSRLGESSEQLREVLHAVLAWRSDAELAAARGFLYLIDPNNDKLTALRLVEQARQATADLEQLRTGWQTLIGVPRLTKETANRVQDWISAIMSGALPREPTTGLLGEVMRSSLQDHQLAEAFFEAPISDGAGDGRTELIAEIVRSATR